MKGTVKGGRRGGGEIDHSDGGGIRGRYQEGPACKAVSAVAPSVAPQRRIHASKRILKQLLSCFGELLQVDLAAADGT